MAYFVSRSRLGIGLGQRELVGWPASMHGFGEPQALFDTIGGFAFDRADLGPPQHTKILALARHIAARGIRSVQLVGHTDAVGTAPYNQGLGQRRAEAVRSALLATLNRMRPGFRRISLGDNHQRRRDAARSRWRRCAAAARRSVPSSATAAAPTTATGAR